MKSSFVQKLTLLLSAVLAIVFLCALSISYNLINEKILISENKLNQTFKDTYYKNYIYKTLTEANNNENLEKPIFESSLEAIITATEKLNMQETFYMKSKGTVITDAGLKVVVKSEQEVWKLSNTEMYQVIEKYQTKGINMGQTNAEQIYILNNDSYIKTSNNVWLNGNEISSNFNGLNWQQTNNKSSTILHYTFNKHTILNAKDLIIFYNSDGSIHHYTAEFNLSTTIGIDNYANVIKNNTGGMVKEKPLFKTIKMRLEIDNFGNLTQLYSYEQCTLKVGIEANLTNEFNYEFFPLTNSPQIEKPNI